MKIRFDNVVIYDGTGDTPFAGSVLTDGNAIASVAHSGCSLGADWTIDARGLALSPGFIDAHGHTDLLILDEPMPWAKLRQGVTTELFDQDGIKKLEKELLAQNATFKKWEYTEKLMQSTYQGKALYMHCLPADITGVSCKEGEVEASVFDRYRTPLYKEASYKPYIIAAMILLARKNNPADTLNALLQAAAPRRACCNCRSVKRRKGLSLP